MTEDQQATKEHINMYVSMSRFAESIVGMGSNCCSPCAVAARPPLQVSQHKGYVRPMCLTLHWAPEQLSAQGSAASHPGCEED